MSFLKKLFGFFLVPKEKKGSIGEIKKILRKSKAKSYETVTPKTVKKKTAKKKVSTNKKKLKNGRSSGRKK